ncbi:MAG: hypothetical protein WCA24_13720 [Thiomonas sp.]
MFQLSRISAAVLSVGVLALLGGCGGGGSSTALTPLNPYSPDNPDANAVACVPSTDVIGAWKTVANNNTVMPDSPNLNFFSYNQPSINDYGLVVFRGRAKSATTGSGGQPQRGVYTVDVCPAKPAVYTVADTANTLVPQPNNIGAMFNEFPSIPRIDMSSGVLATRGQTEPQWTYTDPTTLLDTKVGTTGLYVTLPTGLATGMNILGTVAEFSAIMRVPNTVSTTPVKFDQFPGSPSVTGGKYLVTKGNYTDTEIGTIPATGASGPVSVGKTGVYFRDLSSGTSPIQVIADSNTVIPGTSSTKFGSTAPPSAANGHVVFTGLDIEDAPTAGGIYVAPIANAPTLTPVVEIGKTLVPDAAGAPLPVPSGTTAPTFTLVGEGLAFDGRYVTFWGAWGTGPLDPTTGNGPGMRPVTLTCPTDGNKDLQAACQTQSTNGQMTKYEPNNQGIFIADTQTRKVWMVADAEQGSSTPSQFQDFLYWVFSGAPATTGSSSSNSGSTGPTDAEPPRWRSSAFAAVDGKLGVIFKGSLNPAYVAPAAGASTPASGIYGVNFAPGTGVGPVFKVIALGDDMSILDPAAPAGSYVSSVGIEREGLRGGWLTLTASSLNAQSEGWAGIYATDFPGTAFRTDSATPIPNLILGN